MENSFVINNAPEKVKSLITSFRSDQHLSKTFDVEAKNGKLIGFYTNLAKYNGVVVGYVRVKGNYNHEKGNMNLSVKPSNLFWLVSAFMLYPLIWTIYKSLTENILFLMGTLICSVLILGWTLAFYFERRSFIKHLNRVINQMNEYT